MPPNSRRGIPRCTRAAAALGCLGGTWLAARDPHAFVPQCAARRSQGDFAHPRISAAVPPPPPAASTLRHAAAAAFAAVLAAPVLRCGYPRRSTPMGSARRADRPAQQGGIQRRGQGDDGADGADGRQSLVRSETSADIMRRELWRMPKNIMAHMEEERRSFRSKDTTWVHRDLVVVKGKNAGAMIRKSTALIKRGTKRQSKVLRMMRFGRENFARDIVTERTRGGLRAFRYRSGQRDLREEAKFRRVEQRLPDRYRKRHRWMKLLKKPMRYTGTGKKRFKKF